jgi:hypothetical protein
MNKDMDFELWWKNCLTFEQQVKLIEKRHPNCHNGAGMLLVGLHLTYSKNAQPLYEIWDKENSEKYGTNN